MNTQYQNPSRRSQPQQQQQMSLFDNFFSPMRAPSNSQDIFSSDGFGGSNMSTFSFSFGFVDLQNVFFLLK